MIIDNIKNDNRYKNISKFLKHLQEIDDFSDHIEYYDDVKYIVQSYSTKEYSDELLLEEHHNYIDIQYIISGTEKMGFSDNGLLKKEYDEERDIAFFSCNPSFLELKKGDFIVLFPKEKHIGGLNNVEKNCKVFKIVIKLPIEKYL